MTNSRIELIDIIKRVPLGHIYFYLYNVLKENASNKKYKPGQVAGNQREISEILLKFIIKKVSQVIKLWE